MKSYRVVFRLQSRCRLGRDVVLGLVLPSGARATARTQYWTDQHGTSHPGELSFEMLGEADSAVQAEAQARPDARYLANLFRFLGNGPVGEPRPVVTHEIGDDNITREYHCYLPDSLGLRPTTRIGTTALNDLIVALSALSTDHQRRLQRSMHWHGVALGLDDLLERIQSILNGFEALNPLLASVLGVHSHEVRRCENCSAETRVPVANGLHGWLTQECGPDVDRLTRKFRNGLVHGFETMERLYEIANEVREPVERALVKAIAVCAGAAPLNDLIPWPPLVPTLPFALALHGTCTGPIEAAYVISGAVPEFEPSIGIKSSSYVEDEDRVTVEIQATGTARLADGVGVQLSATTMPVEAGTRVESLAVDFIPRPRGAQRAPGGDDASESAT